MKGGGVVGPERDPQIESDSGRDPDANVMHWGCGGAVAVVHVGDGRGTCRYEAAGIGTYFWRLEEHLGAGEPLEVPNSAIGFDFEFWAFGFGGWWFRDLEFGLGG